jgi:uncharacterized membrane protein
VAHGGRDQRHDQLRKRGQRGRGRVRRNSAQRFAEQTGEIGAVFLGTTLASLLLAMAGAFRWGEPGAAAMLAGGALYVIGMFVCTAVFNVPLNNALAAVDPNSVEAASLWARYLTDWTLWNHVRTMSSTAACALFIWAIAVR